MLPFDVHHVAARFRVDHEFGRVEVRDLKGLAGRPARRRLYANAPEMEVPVDFRDIK
jgi:hypothetical protein